MNIDDPLQTYHDEFYAKNGACCSGCDWWKPSTSQYGDCTKSAPEVSGYDRMRSIGITWSSYQFQAGHMITKFDHRCGDFKDDFDWASLGVPYLKRIKGTHLAQKCRT